jgi:aspartyl-tRNA(Asn)/glutamyl-tRNA(Gln) amidotransferase subunit C
VLLYSGTRTEPGHHHRLQMQLTDVRTETRVNPTEIQKLADLARLDIGSDVIEDVAFSISDVLALVDQLQTANTDGVAPMAHPLDAVQRLRADAVTETNQREAFQAIAPATEDGLYLVPKVIE